MNANPTALPAPRQGPCDLTVRIFDTIPSAGSECHPDDWYEYEHEDVPDLTEILDELSVDRTPCEVFAVFGDDSYQKWEIMPGCGWRLLEEG
jgi:hypothetical protein